MYVYTYDPIAIPLCSSRLGLNWSVDVIRSTITGYQRSKSAWAANPSLANTRWYVDYSNYGSCGYNNSTAWAESYSQYYNYDFINPNLPTYANHNLGSMDIPMDHMIILLTGVTQENTLIYYMVN